MKSLPCRPHDCQPTHSNLGQLIACMWPVWVVLPLLHVLSCFFLRWPIYCEIYCWIIFQETITSISKTGEKEGEGGEGRRSNGNQWRRRRRRRRRVWSSGMADHKWGEKAVPAEEAVASTSKVKMRMVEESYSDLWVCFCVPHCVLSLSLPPPPPSP